MLKLVLRLKLLPINIVELFKQRIQDDINLNETSNPIKCLVCQFTTPRDRPCLRVLVLRNLLFLFFILLCCRSCYCCCVFLTRCLLLVFNSVHALVVFLLLFLIFRATALFTPLFLAFFVFVRSLFLLLLPFILLWLIKISLEAKHAH